MKKALAKYDIHIHGLKDKIHEFTFEGDNSFFNEFEQDIIEGGTFSVNIILDKNVNLIKLNLNIIANLKLQCDRSLETFEETFNIEALHIYKFGATTEELSEDMEMIPFGTPIINIAKILFDYILLEVPIKKIHPKFRSEESGEEGKMVYTDPDYKEEIIEDPRWAALINLKNKN